MQAEWRTLQNQVDEERFRATNQKLAAQLAHAIKWRDTCLLYFQSVNRKDFPDFLKNEIHRE
jgi:alpha-glucuronidase